MELTEVTIISTGPVVTGETVSIEVLYTVTYDSQMVSALTVKTITIESLNEELSTVVNPQVIINGYLLCFLIDFDMCYAISQDLFNAMVVCCLYIEMALKYLT